MLGECASSRRFAGATAKTCLHPSDDFARLDAARTTGSPETRRARVKTLKTDRLYQTRPAITPSRRSRAAQQQRPPVRTSGPAPARALLEEQLRSRSATRTISSLTPAFQLDLRLAARSAFPPVRMRGSPSNDGAADDHITSISRARQSYLLRMMTDSG